MEHFIIDKAKRYKENEASLTPLNGIYDSNLGFWKDVYSGTALVGTEEMSRLNSKKCDRETGEDQKGE